MTGPGYRQGPVRQQGEGEKNADKQETSSVAERFKKSRRKGYEYYSYKIRTSNESIRSIASHTDRICW